MEDLYTAADLYDLAHPGTARGELEFYLRQARLAGPRLLELACGTGRLTLPLAAAGLHLTGLDRSSEMLARARAKAAAAGAAAEFVAADMRAFDLGRPFDLILLPVNSVCHLLTRPDVEACLRCVRAHLAPGGRFVVDVFNPSLALLSADGQRWRELGDYRDAAGQRVRLSEQNRYDAATQVNALVWRFEGEAGWRRDLSLSMRQFFPQELDALLAYNGFMVEAKYGQYNQTEFHSGSNQQLVVARPA